MTGKSGIKYRKLMETAERLFIKSGYKAVSMDQIAQQAQISKMTIYKHFPTKEALFISVCLEIINRYLNSIENELIKIPKTLDKINYLLDNSLKEMKLFSFEFYKDTISIPQLFEPIMAEKDKRIRELFYRIIIEGMQRKEIRQADPDFLTDAIVTMMEMLGLKYIKAINTNEDLEDTTKKLFDILKYGLIGDCEVKENGQ